MTTALLSRVTKLEKATATSTTDTPSAPLFTPLPGPQTRAYESEAFITGYGGAAGGGKSLLEIGLAVTQHRKSIIFRRHKEDVKDLWSKLRMLCGTIGRPNESSKEWQDLPGNRYVRLVGLQHEWDWMKYQGNENDLWCFDEATQFSELSIRTLMAWCRSPDPDQRSRVVLGFNPPTTQEGEWIIEFFAPWISPGYPNPALPGELRWFARIDDEDVECEDGEPFEHEGEIITPLSRTFFPARLEDNPILDSTNYRAVLQGMPEPLRSQMLYGDFTIGREEDAHQVIPTAWVRAAQARWLPDRPELVGTQRLMPQSCVSLDVAEGGRDRTVVARRYGDWVAELIVKPGVETPTPEDSVALIEPLMLDGGYAIVDADMLGGKAYGILRAKFKGRAVAYQGVKPTLWRDKETVFEFLNVRAAAYWAMREALDPSNNSTVALPPDAELRAELCAARWERSGRKIKLEEKKFIKERLGRSPDKADAVVQAFWPHAVLAIPESYGIEVG